MAAQHRLLAGKRPFGMQAELAKHIRNTVACIEIIVYHKRLAVLQFRQNQRLFLFGVQAEREGDRKFGPNARFACYGNGTVHHIHNIFRDGHAEAGSLDFADGAVSFPLEGLKNMRYELRAHTDAAVFDGKFVVAVTVRSARFFCDPHADMTAGSRIFYGIAEQIQKNLIEAELITVNIFVHNVHRIDLQLELFGMNIRLQNIAQAMQDLGKAAKLFIQMYFPAFDMAHIQYVIDQTQQMVSGCLNLFQIFRNLFLLINMCDGKICKSDDSVHRGADVMGHI